MEKPKKLFLDAPAEYDFDLIGIVCGYKSYILASRLNRQLSLDFVRIDDLKTTDRTGAEVDEFSVYEYIDESVFTTYRLFQNKSNGVLLPQYKNMDFFLSISGELTPKDLKVFTAQFSSMQGIQYATPVDPENLKGKEWLMF